MSHSSSSEASFVERKKKKERKTFERTVAAASYMKNCTIVNCAKVFPFVSSDSIHDNATSGKGKQNKNEKYFLNIENSTDCSRKLTNDSRH